MKICIFCASSFGNDSIYKDETIKLVNELCKEDVELVYGGTDHGLMGVVAECFKENKRSIIGVVPQEVEIIVDNTSKILDELHMSESLSDRKIKMIEISDVFIALPGGVGTLDEIGEVVSLQKVDKTHKPCIIYNINHFYDEFEIYYKKMYSEGFMQEELPCVFLSTKEEVVEYLKKYK